MADKIELYGYTTSPYVRKVSCYLYYKGLEFDFIGVSPVEPEKTIGFSDGSQVPVLKIGEEWRRDSSAIGIWLDSLFPKNSLQGTTLDEQQKTKQVDTWASDQFIPSIFFRTAIEAEMTDAFRRRAWRLADIVSSAAEMPDPVKKAWPDLLKQAPFILRMVSELDQSEPLHDMQQRLFMELTAHLGDGLYLSGGSIPSMADFAIYPQIMFPYQVGLLDDLILLQHPTLGPWLKRVAGHLPQNPWCVDEEFIVNPLPFDRAPFRCGSFPRNRTGPFRWGW